MLSYSSHDLYNRRVSFGHSKTASREPIPACKRRKQNEKDSFDRCAGGTGSRRAGCGGGFCAERAATLWFDDDRRTRLWPNARLRRTGAGRETWPYRKSGGGSTGGGQADVPDRARWRHQAGRPGELHERGPQGCVCQSRQRWRDDAGTSRLDAPAHAEHVPKWIWGGQLSDAQWAGRRWVWYWHEARRWRLRTWNDASGNT